MSPGNNPFTDFPTVSLNEKCVCFSYYKDVTPETNAGQESSSSRDNVRVESLIGKVYESRLCISQ